MKIIPILLFAAGISCAYARYRGRDYEQHKICNEYSTLGGNIFKALVIASHSQKFSTAEFEEINALADGVVKLAEKCCAVGTDPNCYDDEATAISEKSCANTTGFPTHPGITECCKSEGLERKLCLADLRLPLEEFPALEETTNEEICQQFQKDPQTYGNRYLYELARRHGNVPIGLLLNVSNKHLNMVAACCVPSLSNFCFLKERLNQKDSMLFLRHASHLCNSQKYIKSFKTGLNVHYGQLIPSASFKEVSPVVKYLEEGLAKCCSNPDPDCLMNEISGFKTALCTDSILPNKCEKFKQCCRKSPVEVFSCIESLSIHSSNEFSKITEPSNEELCKENNDSTVTEYLFEFGKRHQHLSSVILAPVFDGFNKMVTSCCKEADPNICLTKAKPQIKEEMETFSTKLGGICESYHKMDFIPFKQKNRKHLQEKMPTSPPEEINRVAQLQEDFATTCCFYTAPRLRCQELIKAVIGNTCKENPCFII
ncbi:vitamin D-binding protein [Erpetoichthys calabaricus]|uniref:Vitamin D-binding protein n=1 Tax=Erpetoichthys calabaricus TaxID=27687 RepID=A0A8C4SK23_ERPCA|nr:vitamin D-binding protein [Erpetoichthys calabaricus]